MTANQHPVIVGALRTPIGTAGRALAAHDAPRLAATVIEGLVRAHPGIDVDEVVLGNCMGPGGNVARVATLEAGLPLMVPALTVDRQCASGMAAIGVAADAVRRRSGVVVAGGVESASTAPWRYWPPSGERPATRYERAPFAPADLGDPDMGEAADLLAAECGISRERQDRYAARSHYRAFQAASAGRFAAEIVPVGSTAADDRPRAGLTAERLARLKPTFRAEGTVTAGNSCGINDGAAAVLVTDPRTQAGLGIPGLRIRATSIVGTDPARPGRAIVPAVRQALADAGVALSDIDVVEFNEAFAGQILACCDELGLDEERVCPQGGALALGHPWGASGAEIGRAHV